MADENQEQFSEEAETDLQGEGTGEATQENTTQQGLTEEQLRQIMREERELTTRQVAEESAKAFRAMQSMTDKKAAQVKNMARQQVEAMKSAGAQFTPEMESNYVNLIVNNYMESLNSESPETAQPQPQKENASDPLFDAAKATVNHFATKYGVTIDGDLNPELNKLWANKKSYQDFVNKADELLAEKAKSGKTPPQARMASVIPGSGSYTPTKEALTAELQKLLEHPNPKNLKRMEEIQEKLKT